MGSREVARSSEISGLRSAARASPARSAATPALFEAVAAVAGGCGSTVSALTAHYLATDSILIGADDALRLLQVQRDWRAAEAAFAVAAGARASAQVSVFRALGVGWETPEVVAPPQP